MRKQTTKNVSQGTHTCTSHVIQKGEKFTLKNGIEVKTVEADIAIRASSVQLTFTWLRIVEFVLMMTT